MSDRAINTAAGAARGTARATAQASVYGPDIDYRLSEAAAEDQGRITEDGIDYRILDEAITAASAGSATGTSTAAAVSTAEVPPIVVLLGGGAPRVWERVVSAEGHAAGTSSCEATGRAIVAGTGLAHREAAAASEGLARRYLHDDEIMILLEAA